VKKRFSVIFVMALVLSMVFSSVAMAAVPGVQISNELVANVVVTGKGEIPKSEWITLSWDEEGTDGTIDGAQRLIVNVEEGEEGRATITAEKHVGIEQIENVLYVMEIRDNFDEPVDQELFNASAEQDLGYDEEGGYWYWGLKNGFTLNLEQVSTSFTYSFNKAGTYQVEIFAVQLLEGEIVRNQGELDTALANEALDTIILAGEFSGFYVARDVKIIGGVINPAKFGGTNAGILVAAGKTVELDSVTINGNDEVGSRGVEVSNNVDLIIRDSKINKVTSGIYLNPGSTLTAINNEISNTVAGIGSDQAELTMICGNVFTKCDEGIGLNKPIDANGNSLDEEGVNGLANILRNMNTFKNCTKYVEIYS
jgi:hypothetical protein